MSSFLRKLNREVGGVPVNRRDRRAAYAKTVAARKEAFKLINLACFDPVVNNAITLGVYEEFKSEPMKKRTMTIFKKPFIIKGDGSRYSDWVTTDLHF